MPVLVLVLVALLVGSHGDAARPAAARQQSELVFRLWQKPDAVIRDVYRPLTVFGLRADEVRMVLLPVSRWRGAPPGYQPPDLVHALRRPVRSIVTHDFVAMAADAAINGIDLRIVSGYRSPEEQAATFEAAVWRRLGRESGRMDRAEAESQAARFVAPPGHSQHQLGTAIDLSTGEIGYTLQPRFAETAAGRWIVQRAWEYGFVLPYPQQGESRTGYAFEPWHVRWIGRGLAGALQEDGYLDHPNLVADDYLLAVEQIMNVEGVP